MTKKPNIVLIFSDQHRYDAVGCNGAALCRTPEIDRIAGGGMRFSHAFTPVALCSPARGSLMTGLYPHNHGQLANTGNFNRVFDTQVLSQTSFTEILHRAGYHTGWVGKWHLPREGDREAWGIQQWYSLRDWGKDLERQGIDFDCCRDHVQPLEWGADAPFCGRAVLPADKMPEACAVDQAVGIIRAQSGVGRPFMLGVSLRGPHFPYAVPQPFDTMYDPAAVPRWGNFDDTYAGKPTVQQKEQLRWNASHLTWPDWQRVVAHYWGYCSYIDVQVGRILDCLSEFGVDEDTVVIYTADHGDMLGGHRLFNKGMNMYEETHHIPMMIRWPGFTEPGAVCDSFSSLVDIMPTILEMAGLSARDNLDGRSLVPLLRGDLPADWPDDGFCEFHGYESALCSIRMVRTKKWKYVYNPCSRDELYDLESDPWELRNLAAEPGFKHVLRRMKERLVARLRETGDSIVSEDGWKGCSYDLVLSRREI